jgi:hypothetical protein
MNVDAQQRKGTDTRRRRTTASEDTMLRSMKDLRGFSIGAIDGDIGTVTECYFDDASLAVRYVVVETGGWLADRKGLLSPIAFRAIDWEHKRISTGLTKAQVESSSEPAGPNDPHLRSSAVVTGYHIEAVDGDIGHVEDFLVDDASWAIRFMVVDTANWWAGEKVLVAPAWIDRVDWDHSKVHVTLTRAQIERSPGYDPDRPVGRAREKELYRHGDPRSIN